MSYDIDKYYRETLNITTQPKEKKKLKGWKALANGGYDHQFFDNTKLDALDEKEQTWLNFQQNQEEFLKQNDNQKAAQFSKKDQQQRENLLKQGFSNWSKKEFFLFIRMCETYGRDNYSKISEAFQNKSVGDVSEYA